MPFMMPVNLLVTQHEFLKGLREFHCLWPIRRKIVVAKQNYRCAGCGTRIDPGTLNKTLKIYPLFEYSSETRNI